MEYTNKLQILDKLENDKSNYYYGKLDNGLKFIIVEDKDIKNSAVMLRVNVGYMQDDPKICGQAHLLEHMLFNGTKKYPNENHFSKFVDSNNGYSNAYTSDDHTCYHYNVCNEKILKSLEIFSDFFINPTLNNNCISREKEAVNAEHCKNLFDGSRIDYEIFKKAMNQKSPFCKFSTGCNHTLKIDKDDNNNLLGQSIREFYEKYYSANIMTLVIASPINKKQMHKNIKKYFRNITNKKMKPDENKEIFIDKSKEINMIPITDTHEIIFNWNVRSYYNDYTKSPLSFLSHLLGNEEKNTIYKTLMEMEYIKSLSAGPSYSNKKHGVFTIGIECTKLGFENLDKIKSVVYDYIELLKDENNKDILRGLYEDYEKTIKFKSSIYTKYSSCNRVSYLCNVLNDNMIKPKNILVKYKYIKSFDDIYDNFKKELGNFNNKMSVVLVKSKIFGEICYPCNTELTYYNHVKYVINEKLPDKSALPDKNDYISTNEVIYKCANDLVQLKNNDNLSIYLLSNDKYKIPDIHIYLNVKFENLFDKIDDKIRMLIYLNAFKLKQNDLIYRMKCAGYYVGIHNSICEDMDMDINIRGNDEKMFRVYSTIIDEFGKNVDIKYIDLAKQLIYDDCLNSKYKAQYKLFSSLLESKINKQYVSDDIIINRIKNLDLNNDFMNSITKNTKIKMLIAGNILREHSDQYVDVLMEKFKCKLENNMIFDDNIIKPLNPEDKNSSMAMYYYIGNNDNMIEYLKNSAKLEILNAIMHEEYFSQLRTQECYGYIVNCSSYTKSYNEFNRKIYLYQRFLVQSPSHSCDDIIKRTELFIKTFGEKINKYFSETTFANIVKSKIDELEKDFNSLNEYSSYVFKKIYDGKFIDTKKMLIDEYKKINIHDIIDFYNNNMVKKGMVIGINGENN